jgi:hypothetical protein
MGYHIGRMLPSHALPPAIIFYFEGVSSSVTTAGGRNGIDRVYRGAALSGWRARIKGGAWLV